MLTGIALNLHVNLGRTDILAILILLIDEDGISISSLMYAFFLLALFYSFHCTGLAHLLADISVFKIFKCCFK